MPVGALTGEGDSTLQVSNGEVSVDLAAFLTVVKQRLVDAGFQLAQRIRRRRARRRRPPVRRRRSSAVRAGASAARGWAPALGGGPSTVTT